jgi:hypothetical protein
VTFGRILQRGFFAANRSLAGLALLIVVYGTYEGVSIVMSDTAGIRELLTPLGAGPPPEDVVTMGRSCFACAWLFVVVFGGPCVVGGIIGQLRDRISAPDQPAGNFGWHAEMFYLPILVLTLTSLAVALLLTIPVWLLSMGISELPSLSGLAEPLPKGISAVIGKGVSLVFMLAIAIVVTEYEEPFRSLKIAFSFLKRHVADFAMLFVVVGALHLTWWLLQQGLLLVLWWLSQQGLLLLAVLGTVTAVIAPYIMLLSMAWIVSLWLARRPGAVELVDLVDVELRAGADGGELT